MKKSLLLACFFARFTLIDAQVCIEPTGSSIFNITVPVENQLFAEYRIISESVTDYLYIDTCDITFCGWGNFSSFSLSEVTLLVDSQFRLMQMELPGDDWQLSPMVLIGFPSGGIDTAIISFFADIPDTCSLIELGDYLITSISCRYFFGSNVFVRYSTDIAYGQILSVDTVSALPEVHQDTKLSRIKIWPFDKFNILGQEVK